MIFVVLHGSVGLYWMADIKMQVFAFDKDASKSINENIKKMTTKEIAIAEELNRECIRKKLESC